MRVYVRLTRNVGVSLGPVALLILAPLLFWWWAAYLAWLLVALLVALTIRLAGRQRSHAGRSRPRPR